MSVGIVCACTRRDHDEPPFVVARRARGEADPMSLEPGSCRKYAADQMDPAGRCVDCDGHWTEREPKP